MVGRLGRWIGGGCGGETRPLGLHRARALTGSVGFDFFLVSLHSPSIAGHLNSINWLVDSHTLFAVRPHIQRRRRAWNWRMAWPAPPLSALLAMSLVPIVSFLGHQISAVQDRRGLSPNTEPGAPSLAHRPLPCCSHSPKLQGVASAPRPGTSSDELDWRSLTD